MSEFVRPLTVARDKLARALNGQPEVVRAVESLIKRVGTDIPEESASLLEFVARLQHESDGVRALALAALQQAGRRARAGDGLDLAADGAGDVLSVNRLAVVPFLQHPQATPDVRAGAGVTVTRDAAGYVVAAINNDAQAILAAQIFGKH